MRLSISTQTADPFGSITLEIDATATNLGDTSRRVSRVATLDGGASIIDGGYTVADRTITVDLTGQDRETVDTLRYLFQTYSELVVLTEEGAFLATPERITSGTSPRMTLLVSGTA